MRRLLLLWSVLGAAGTLTAAIQEQSVTFASCRASWDGRRLLMANRYIEREWRWRDGRLQPTSFRDLTSGAEWLSPAPADSKESPAAVTFAARSGKMSPVEAPSLLVEISVDHKTAYRLQLFPEARGVLMQGELESFTLAAEHVRVTQVTLVDQTDGHNELVFEKEWLLQRNEKPLQLSGNLFVLENTLTKAGLAFLKFAPLPHARPVPEAWDLEAGLRGHGVRCHFTAGESGYRYVVLAYTGGRAGRTEALQTFQRQLRPYVPGRDARFLSNTWGDRSRDARISAEFMQKEIEAGAALGVDVVQLDDGWQTGRTANSARGAGVWNGFWQENPNFWQPDPARFPDGLKPLAQRAAAKGMKIGLWYAPDSSNDFQNWQRDAGRLLELYRNDGIAYFKIDGVKATTKAGEQNLKRLFELVQSQSEGQITFDLDVTAETRPGYFGLPETGPLFVENRYTDMGSYWPHQTLRNLWRLASYVDPLRIRMELLNQERNQDKYAGDPLGPANYRADTLFAIVMMANPLGWFEVSNLPEDYHRQAAPLIQTWKAQRDALFQDTILPIGEEPDGTNWTGFAAFNHEHTAGYLLLFRGVGAPAEYRLPLNVFGVEHHRTRRLGGSGEVVVQEGQMSARIPVERGFVWVAVE